MAKRLRGRRRRWVLRVLLVAGALLFVGGLAYGFWLGRTRSLDFGYIVGRLVEKFR